MRPKIVLVPPKKGRTPFWHIRGSYLEQAVNQSARTTERAVAAKELARVKAEIECHRYRKQAGPDFIDAASAYLDFKADIGDNDRKFIEALVTYFAAKPIDEINHAAVDKAAVTLLPAAQPATRNREVYTPVSAILRHYGVQIALRRPEGSQGKARTHWLRIEEAKALLVSAWQLHPRFAAFCTFLLYTGCRLSEGARLQVSDLHLDEGYALVGVTKNGEPRGVHLPPIVVRAIRLALAEPGNATWVRPKEPRSTGSVFCLTKSGALYDLLDVVEDFTMWRRAQERTGLEANVTTFRKLKATGVDMLVDELRVIPPGVSFHVFRHTYGAWMRRYGGVERLEETGAWSSRAGAKTYDHFDVSATARRADLLPGACDGEAPAMIAVVA